MRQYAKAAAAFAYGMRARDFQEAPRYAHARDLRQRAASAYAVPQELTRRQP